MVKAGFQNFFGYRPPRLFEIAPDRRDSDPRAADRLACPEAENVSMLAYKARPLDGIGATARCLPNGSAA